jgi:hypothetical protein
MLAPTRTGRKFQSRRGRRQEGRSTDGWTNGLGGPSDDTGGAYPSLTPPLNRTCQGENTRVIPWLSRAARRGRKTGNVRYTLQGAAMPQCFLFLEPGTVVGAGREWSVYFGQQVTLSMLQP